MAYKVDMWVCNIGVEIPLDLFTPPSQYESSLVTIPLPPPPPAYLRQASMGAADGF